MKYNLAFKFLKGGWRNKIFNMAEVANNIPKIEQRIETTLEKVGGSEEGVLWVKESLDPFCDQPRRVVGFPDLITGNSIVQCVKQSVQFTVGATPQDVHIFLDTLDTSQTMSLAPQTVDGFARARNWQPPTEVAMSVSLRGGLMIRYGPVGTPLTETSTRQQLTLPASYLDGGSTRVLSKAFEVHNTTNQLNVGGSVCVYRSSAAIPYDNPTTGILTNPATITTNGTYSLYKLTTPPVTLSECILNPGAQQWNAKEGCYVVAIMAAQTNNPQDEHAVLVTSRDSSTAANSDWISSFIPTASPGVVPQPIGGLKLFSPFFLSGAYFTGLPANSTLTINLVYVIERFVDSTNLDLITLASPSPHYDPVSLEVYSKSAAKLPAGVKVTWNADGDWIKNVADVLSSFGVPGMPLVKGAVDLWNGFKKKDDPARKVGRIQGSTWTGNVNSLPPPMNARPRRQRQQRLPAPPRQGQQPKKKKKKRQLRKK